MDRKTRRQLTKMVYNENKIKKSLKRQREKGLPTDIIMVDKIGAVENADIWIKIIELSYREIGKDEALVKKRYRTHKSLQRLEIDEGKTIKTIFTKCDKFLNLVLHRACSRGLIFYE